MAENTIMSADVAARVADVEFVRAFTEDIRKLAQLLRVFQPVKRRANTALKYYKTSGTLQSGTVGEGEDIPLSKYKRTGERIAELSWSKWAKETTLEAISANSYSEAVTETDRQFILDIQKGVRRELADFLKGGTGKGADGQPMSGATLQKALATIWGNMQVIYENTDASPINFASALDFAEYLGDASVTTQTAFGMTYIANFLGMYDTILLSDIPQGTIITTPRENLHLYYADAAEAEGFEFYHDETGYVGVHHDPTYRNMTFQTYAVSALKPFCDYLDKIHVTTITGE